MTDPVRDVDAVCGTCNEPGHLWPHCDEAGEFPGCPARWHGVHFWLDDECQRCGMERRGSYDQAMHQTVEAESVPETVFTADDRCDRCGAQAKMRAQFSSGVLLFCGHHGRVHAEAIARAVHVPRAL